MSAVTISTTLPATGFVCPTDDDELRTLIRMVLGAHEHLREYAEATEDFEQQFGRAFVAVGYAFRTVEPVTNRYFQALVDDANELLQRYWRAPAVSGPAFLTACWAHGDIPIRPAKRSLGQLLEIGLDPDSGLRCGNFWRQILAGRPLRAPLAPRRFLQEMNMPSTVSYFQQGWDGRMREVAGDVVDLWRR
jgi:hypothetical protein